MPILLSYAAARGRLDVAASPLNLVVPSLRLAEYFTSGGWRFLDYPFAHSDLRDGLQSFVEREVDPAGIALFLNPHSADRGLRNAGKCACLVSSDRVLLQALDVESHELLYVVAAD